MINFHIDEEFTMKEAAQLAISKVLKIWQCARIPHQRIDSVIRILTKLYDQYEKLKKNRLRCNANDMKKQDGFEECLVRLFDIATSDALVTMKVEEDKQFLIKQRQDVLSCSMAGVDNVLAKKEKRKRERNERIKKYATKEQVVAENSRTSMEPLAVSVPSASDLTESQSVSQSDSDSNSSDTDFKIRKAPCFRSLSKR
jgi:hypothetical protein